MINTIQIIAILILGFLLFICDRRLIRTKRQLSLTFTDWDKTLDLWAKINSLQASRQNVSVDSLYEETLRNICVQEKIQRADCNKK